jgi:hypothetical protein
VDTAIIAALAEEAAVESFIATTAATTHVYVYFEKGNNILAEASISPYLSSRCQISCDTPH